jgi:transposase-like protein
MPIGRHVDSDIKNKVLVDVRDNGLTVTDVGLKYSVNNKTIYRWLKENVVSTSTNLILENNRLKKENEQLYNLLGRATVEMKKLKK